MQSKHLDRLITGKSYYTAVLMAVLLAFGLMVLPVSAQTKRDMLETDPHAVDSPLTSPVTISAPLSLQYVDTTFTIPISFSDVVGDGIISFQFNIQYDPNLIIPSGPNFGCSTAGTMASHFSVNCNVVTPGTMLISSSTGSTAMSGVGAVLNITFDAHPSALPGDISPLNFVPGSIFVFNHLGMFANVGQNGHVRFRASTAADVSISGRVVTAKGRAVAKARLSMVDGEGNLRYALTNGFGYYHFQGVPAGETYIVHVNSKQYNFTPRTINLMDEMTGLDFVAEP